MDLFESLIGSKIIPSGGGGGGAALNIAYSQTAPEDTSKIWIKADQPESLDIKLVNRNIKELNIAQTSTAYQWFSFAPGFWKNGLFYGAMYYNTSSYSTSYIPHLVSFNPNTGTFTDLINLQSKYGFSTYGNYLYCWFNEATNKIVILNASYSSTSANRVSIDFDDYETYTKDSCSVPSTSSYYINQFVYDNKYCLLGRGSANQIAMISIENGSISYKSIPTNINYDNHTFHCFLYGNYLFFPNHQLNKICRFNMLTDELDTYDVYLNNEVSTLPSTLQDVFTFDGVTLFLCCGFNSSNPSNLLYKLSFDSGKYTAVAYDTVFQNSIHSSDYVLLTNTQAFIINSSPRNNPRAIYGLTFGWGLTNNSAELYLSFGDGTLKAYLLDSNGIKQEVNSAKYFYGNSTGKATSAPVYYHNGINWVEFT